MNPTFDSNFTSESPSYAPCSYTQGQWSYWGTLGDKWRVDTKQWPRNSNPSCADKNMPKESYSPRYSYSRLNETCGSSDVSPQNSPASSSTMLSFNAFAETPYAAFVQSANPQPGQFSISQTAPQALEGFTSVNKYRKYLTLDQTWSCSH